MDLGTSLLGDRGYTGLREPVKAKVGKGLKKAAPRHGQLSPRNRDNDSGLLVLALWTALCSDYAVSASDPVLPPNACTL